MNVQAIYQETLLYASEKYGCKTMTEQGLPLIMHISAVAAETIFAASATDNFNTEFAVQLALLHDIIEDLDVAEAELDKTFGKTLTAAVKAMTKNTKLPKEQRMLDSVTRIKDHPYEVWAVKLADRITNLYQRFSYLKEEKKRAYYEDSKMILRELGDGNAFLAERLGRLITGIEAHYEFPVL